MWINKTKIDMQKVQKVNHNYIDWPLNCINIINALSWQLWFNICPKNLKGNLLVNNTKCKWRRLCVPKITTTVGSSFCYYFLMSFFFWHVLYSFKNMSELSVYDARADGSWEAGQALIHMCRGGCVLRGSGAPPKRCGDVSDLLALLWRAIHSPRMLCFHILLTYFALLE